MPKVTYIGTDDPTDSATCTVFGQDFISGQPVEMDTVHPKLRANPTFRVEGEDVPKARKGRAAQAGEPTDDAQ